MIVYIKNMVCERCRMRVKNILSEMDLSYSRVDLGAAELNQSITSEQKEILRHALLISGLELINDNNEILVDKIKHCIIYMIRNDASISHLKTSYFLSNYLGYNYTYLANVFSQETGVCLRDFIIAHRIEKVKEMLLFENLSVTQIAWKLNYSSVAHLSNQFTKITGSSPSRFKKDTGKFFTPLDEIGKLEVACAV